MWKTGGSGEVKGILYNLKPASASEWRNFSQISTAKQLFVTLSERSSEVFDLVIKS